MRPDNFNANKKKIRKKQKKTRHKGKKKKRKEKVFPEKINRAAGNDFSVA